MHSKSLYPNQAYLAHVMVWLACYLFIFGFALENSGISTLGVNSSGSAERVDLNQVYIINGLVVDSNSNHDASLIAIPVTAQMQRCESAFCSNLKTLDVTTQADGTFNVVLDTAKFPEPSEISRIRVSLQANFPHMKGYHATLTSSRQDIYLTEPVTQVSFVLNPTTTSTPSNDTNLGILAQVLMSLGMQRDSLPWYVTKSVLSAPEHGQSLLYRSSKLGFAALQRIYLIARDILEQFHQRAQKTVDNVDDATLAKLCSVGPVDLSSLCMKPMYFAEYLQFLMNLALDRVESTPWTGAETGYFAYRTCKGMGGSTLTTCSRGDAYAQLLLVAVGLLIQLYFIKALLSPGKRSKIRGSKPRKDETQTPAPTTVQRFVTGTASETAIIGLGKNTSNVLVKDGSKQLFHEVAQSQLSRVAWMTSSSSSSFQSPVRGGSKR